MAEPFFKSPWGEDLKPEELKAAIAETDNQPKQATTLPILPILIGGVAILIIGVGLFLTMRLVGQESQSASLDLKSPSEVLVGQPFDLEVIVRNESGENIKNGKVSVFLPPEMNFAGQSPSQRVHEEMVGDIEKLGVLERSVKIIAASGTESVSRIQARFSYVQSGSTAQFEKSKTIEILIGPPAVTLDLFTPENILSGGNFDTKITITNRTDEPIENLNLVLNFPQNYILASSNGTSTATTTWSMGGLTRGEVKTLTVIGSLAGQESDFINLTASLRRTEGAEEYIVSEKTASLSIAAPPLALTIRPSVTNAAPRLGEQISYMVSLKNNTEVTLENLTVRATLVGNLFNLSSINTNGLFNSVNNTITWTPSTAPSLIRLLPGETQSLSFIVAVKDSFPITRQSDKNYLLKINGSAESPTAIPNVSSEKTFVLAKNETKVAGFIGLRSKVYYKNPTTQFTNSGPYPPKANQTTRYTVYWTLQNYATDMSRIEVSSYLEPYSRLIGKPISNIDAVPIYNSASGQIVWRIDKLLATQGVLGNPVQAIFQIESTPPNPYIGHDAPLLRATTLRANDEFIGREFTNSTPATLSNLPDDPSLGTLDRTVQP